MLFCTGIQFLVPVISEAYLAFDSHHFYHIPFPPSHKVTVDSVMLSDSENEKQPNFWK